jgi:DNA-binding LacI/PurR family transcriptional regulator
MQSLGRSSRSLADVVRERIVTGELESGKYLPSIRELCAQHSLAPVTVSRALASLKGEGLLVAEPRRGYRVATPEDGAQAHAPLACVLSVGEQQSQWGVLVQNLVGFSQAQAMRRFRPLLVVNARDRAPADIVEQLRAGRICGTLVDASDPLLLAALTAAGFPVVMCEAWRPGLSCDVVVQDGFGGAMLAVEYLIARGHRRIGWLGAVTESGEPMIAERLGGALAGLARAGLTLPAAWRVDVPFDDPPAADEAARRLLSLPERPTAILTLWGHVSQAMARVAREMGMVIGRDVEIVAWCSEEAYDHSHRLPFAGDPLPPAMTWSVAELVDVAVSRLEHRLIARHLPPLAIRIPVSLRLP